MKLLHWAIPFLWVSWAAIPQKHLESINTELLSENTQYQVDAPIVVDVWVENQTDQDIEQRQFSPLSSSVGLPDFVIRRVPDGREFSIPPGLYGDDWNQWYQPASGKAATSVGNFRLPSHKRIHLLHGDLRLTVAHARRHCQSAIDEKFLPERPENASTKKSYQNIVRDADDFLSGGTFDVYVRAYSKSNTIRIVVNRKDSSKPALGCKIIPYKGEEVSYGTEDLRGGAECEFEIHPDLPVYSFRLIADATSNTIVRVEISTEKDTPLQVLNIASIESPYKGSKYFGIHDINFDGYQDIRLLAWWGVTGNQGYLYWVFDPQTGKFVEARELEELSNPVLHPETKTITTTSVGGMAGKIHFFNTYAFERGKLILIRMESQDWDEKKKRFVKTISERKNGKMVVISTEIVSDE
jgi:hypothetical protein